jgi:GNAT superfamily N-acetyltransferase
MFEPLQVAKINEHRQALATSELVDDRARLADGWMSFAPGVKWCNCATGAGLSAALGDAELDALEAFYKQRGVSPTIELTTLASAELLGKLGRRGFRIEHFENVLARALAPSEDPFASIAHGLPAGLELRETDKADAGQVAQQAALVSAGFRLEGAEPDAADIDILERAIRHARSTSFMGFVDGQLAGACSMEICTIDGVTACSLWGTAVSKPFRRRGIQQALIARRLLHAIEHGCTLAIIESKPGIPTERNAARLGFVLSYVRFMMSKPEPESRAKTPEPAMPG